VTTAQYLWHVTLNTGHGRRSYADEVAPDIRAALRPILDDALAAGDARAIVPYLSGISLQANTAAGHLIATVWDDDGDWPLVTLAVARKSLGAPRLWAMMHEGYQDLATNRADVPHAPWCAVRLEPSLPLRLDATSWLGDFERCLAWAWLDR
jgi:hypothetical protein